MTDLLTVATLCREAERLLSAEILTQLSRFASLSRDAIDQSSPLATLVAATAELQRLHTLGNRCRSCAARLPAHAAELAAVIVGDPYASERLRGLIEGLQGAKPLRDRKPSGSREAAWAAGVELGASFRAPVDIARRPPAADPPEQG